MRRPHDFYPTPAWATEILVSRGITIHREHTILEPCHGKGAITNVLQQHGIKKVITNDIALSSGTDYKLDARYPGNWNYFHMEVGKLPITDWVITNPPFTDAIDIVKQSYHSANIGIAMLLRLSFLEPVNSRIEFLDNFPPTKLLILPRISFTGNGKTDSVTCGWLIWEKHYPTHAIKVVRK